MSKVSLPEASYGLILPTQARHSSGRDRSSGRRRGSPTSLAAPHRQTGSLARRRSRAARTADPRRCSAREPPGPDPSSSHVRLRHSPPPRHFPGHPDPPPSTATFPLQPRACLGQAVASCEDLALGNPRAPHQQVTTRPVKCQARTRGEIAPAVLHPRPPARSHHLYRATSWFTLRSTWGATRASASISPGTAT